MNIESTANCVLIIVRDYYLSLGESIIKLHQLRDKPYKFPRGGPILYKHRSLLHQCDKKGNFMPYLKTLSLIEIGEIMQLCVEQLTAKPNGMNNALTTLLGNDIKAIDAEFSLYNKEDIDNLNFPRYPKYAIKCANAIISEIDNIVKLYRARAQEKTKSKEQNRPEQKLREKAITTPSVAPIVPPKQSLFNIIFPAYEALLYQILF